MIFRSTTLAALMFCAAGAFPARAETLGYERVISTVTLSFEDDGSTDRAVLVDNFDAGADLYIFRAIEDIKPDSPMKSDAGEKGGRLERRDVGLAALARHQRQKLLGRKIAKRRDRPLPLERDAHDRLSRPRISRRWPHL